MAQSKGNLKAYRRVLQDTISISDATWSYNIPGFPRPEEADRQGLVKSISLTTEGPKHRLTFQFQPLSVNRAISSDPLNRFILISVSGFRPIHHQPSSAIGTQPSTGRECTDYAVKLLRSGIELCGVHYNFYGHSNSQLKSRTTLLFAGTKDEIHRKIEAFGDFAKMKTVQKKAKRIGLLFSVAQVAMEVQPSQCEDIPDVETADYVFTDGCGLIAPHLARELSRRVGIMFRNVRYTPSVFQIRYRGYKGVVELDPRMKEKTLLKLRKSMKKFSGGTDYSFSVVAYSKVRG